MPFWSDTNKNENYKAKLEHKMCIAKDTPESSFDLTDCNLYAIPSGVFSMCHVFLKESLFLDNNNLSSLQNGGPMKFLSRLKVLSLKNNRISSLPDDIYYLNQLKDLNLENNRLKKLPASFSKLNLARLNLKGNKLVAFPSPVCSLHSLEYLNICDNPKVKILPKELCNLVLLKCLELDARCIVYPSDDITNGGTESIMKFLCAESGKEYTVIDNASSLNETDVDVGASGSGDTLPNSSSDLSASYLQYQRSKERRQKELVLMEEALKENYEIQSSSAADANLRRQKLLEDIVQEQERMENEIFLLQNRKEKEKQSLLEILTKVEDHSAKLIKHLMSLADRTKNLDKMLEVLEKDRLDNDEIFIIKQEELEQLRKKEILEAMTEMLQCEEKQRKYEMEKDNITAKLQNEENESNLRLLNFFQDREIDQQILINKLLEEEQFQKQAFEVLQLQKDLQHQEIAHQIHLVEKELFSLTAAEIKKKNLKINTDINTLSEHRTALAYLLQELLVAKEEREKELKERLKQMEMQRISEMEDFWLIQYQKLLDRKPKGVSDAENKIDKQVRQVLFDADALDFLPLFAAKHVTLAMLINFTVEDIKRVGVLDEDICQTILDKAWEYYKNIQSLKDEYPGLPELQEAAQYATPSAPPEEDEPLPPTELLNPSAPALSPDVEVKLWCQTECVICLETQSSSVFLPCGHVCCCQACSSSVEICPMCRSAIASKFILSVS